MSDVRTSVHAESPNLRRRLTRPSFSSVQSFATRVVYFLLVWTLLLFVHEGGHALSAWRHDLHVRSVTVGVGPRVGSTQIGNTEWVLRVLPVAGMTNVGAVNPQHAAAGTAQATRVQMATLLGGIMATLVFGLAIAGIVFWRERVTGRRWLLGRFIVADAVVLTVFNFFPVPPLDGGRAILSAIAAMRGAPLAGDALFWVQASGMALALIPMTLWTRWTSRIDAVAAHWHLPQSTTK